MAGEGVVEWQQHPLDTLAPGVVEGEQFAHQGEGHARRCRLVDALALQRDISAVVATLENAVLCFKVEQRARGDRDHQFVGQSHGHGYFTFTNWFSSMIGSSTASTI